MQNPDRCCETQNSNKSLAFSKQLQTTTRAKRHVEKHNFVAFVSKPKVEVAGQQSKFTKTKLITDTRTLNREP